MAGNVKWEVSTIANRDLLVVGNDGIGMYARVLADGKLYVAHQEGIGADVWAKGAETVDAIAVDPLDVAYATTVTLDPSERDVHQVGELTGNLEIDWENVVAGQSGFVYVQQPASGTTTRTVTINAPTGFTLLAATTVADLVAQTGASAVTRYVYATFTGPDGVSYMELGMAHLVAAP